MNTEVHNTEVEEMEQLQIEGTVGQSPHWMMKLAGSDLKTEGYHLYIETLISV